MHVCVLLHVRNILNTVQIVTVAATCNGHKSFRTSRPNIGKHSTFLHVGHETLQKQRRGPTTNCCGAWMQASGICGACGAPSC
jgi:hypothetical protein